MHALPDDSTARPLRLDDVPAAAALLAAAEAADRTGEHLDADDLTEWWGSADVVGPAAGGLAVEGPDGALVAWGTAVPVRGVRDTYRVELEGRVHPGVRARGIGRALLGWQVERGRGLHARQHPALPARLTVSVYPAMTSLEGLLRRAGFVPDRRYWEMERPLTDLPEIRPAAGVEVVPFDPSRDEEVRQAHNEAFAAHHGSVERDPVSWSTWFTGQRAFRPDLSVLALADGAVVGYVLAYVFEADTRATGVRQAHLGQIGVLPPARGKGVASAAVAAALHRAAVRGCRSAGLQVDTANATGAPALYRRLGFEPVRTRTSWALDLPPVG